MRVFLLLLATLALAACHQTTAPVDCDGIIQKGGPYHADTLSLRCR